MNIKDAAQRAWVELLGRAIAKTFDIDTTIKVTRASKELPDGKVRRYKEVYIYENVSRAPTRALKDDIVRELRRTEHVR